jgi:hypothetical protein
MTVINDMTIAMDGQRRWTEDPIKGREHRARRAKIYFMRLQLAHIYEPMKIVEEIRQSADLTSTGAAAAPERLLPRLSRSEPAPPIETSWAASATN